MWSEYSLEVVDTVARNGSFSAAAQGFTGCLPRSAIPCVRLEEWLAVPYI